MTAVPVSGLVGGPLSGMLLSLNGYHGLAGWQWLYLGEGVPAIILGVVVLFCLTDRPQVARWLTPEERDSIVAELATEQSSESTTLWRTLLNPDILRLGAIFLLAALGFYGYSFWSPLVIKSLTGTSDIGVGWISAVISAITIVFMMFNGLDSDRTGERPRHVAVALVVMSAGFLLSAFVRAPLAGVAALALVPIGHCSAYGPFWSIPSRLLSGRVAAAGTAMVVTIANVGGFVGPSLIGYLKERTGTHTTAFLLLGILGMVAALLVFTMRIPTNASRQK
jgi:ACS family tartrate transporter-like MFS transporter